MADKNFDDNVKKILEDSQMDYDPSSWSAMNDKLDLELGNEVSESLSELQSDDQLDQILKEKLENTIQSYDPTSWGDLAEKIEKDEELRGRILRIGLIQCLVALLLLMSLWNWKGAELVQEKKNEELAETEIQFAFIQLHEHFYQQFASDLKKERVSLYDLTFPIIELEKIIFKSSSSIFTSFQEINRLSTLSYSLVSTETRLQNLAGILSPKNIVVNEKNNFSTSNKTEKSLLIEKINEVDRINSTLQTEEVFLEHEKSVLIDFKPEKKQKVEKAITGIFSPDLYLIRSSDDPIYPLPSYFTDSYGLTGGALFSLKSKSIELETGFLYSSVSYRPRQITEQYSSRGQYFETSLNDILFNVISIPIQFKWHFDIGSSSSFYVLAGSSFNMIINSNFNIYNAPIATPISGLADLKENKPLLDEKDFEPGLLEGGDIFDNSFITADLGIGFQQRVAKRLSFFVQPTLSTQFSRGIGPNQDKLHRASLFLGAKYHLN